MFQEASTFQSVPVPTGLVLEVYRFLTERAATSASTPHGDPVRDDDEEKIDSVMLNDTEWTTVDIDELNRRVKNPAGRAILSLIAARTLDGEQSSYEGLRVAGANALGEEFNYDRLRAQLSWIAKYSKAIKGTHVWPIVVEDRSKSSNPPPPKGERHWYRMPVPVAQWWLNAADDAAQ